MSVKGLAYELPLSASYAAGKNSFDLSQDKAAASHIDFMPPKAMGGGRRLRDGKNAAAVMAYKPKIAFDHRLALDGAGGYGGYGVTAWYGGYGGGAWAVAQVVQVAQVDAGRIRSRSTTSPDSASIERPTTRSCRTPAYAQTNSATTCDAFD